MIRKIKLWWLNKRHKTPEIEVTGTSVLEGTYTYEQLENAYILGYNDGKRDGLSIARQQATKSLKEILSWQNQNNSQKK
jgi:hypothetical protein